MGASARASSGTACADRGGPTSPCEGKRTRSRKEGVATVTAETTTIKAAATTMGARGLRRSCPDGGEKLVHRGVASLWLGAEPDEERAADAPKGPPGPQEAARFSPLP